MGTTPQPSSSQMTMQSGISAAVSVGSSRVRACKPYKMGLSVGSDRATSASV